MISAELPQLLLDRKFSDTDEYASNIEWEFDFRQLDAGSLRARAALLGTSQTVVMRSELNRAFHQSGKPPTTMLTFGLPDPADGEFRWCRRSANGGDLLNFNLESGFEGVSQAGFSGFAISFTETLLQEVCEILELNVDYRDKISAAEVWRNADHFTGRLRQRLFAALESVPKSNSTDAIELFNFSAAALLLEFLSEQDAFDTRDPLPFRRCALRMTMGWIEETDELPLTVMDLCKKTGFSAPTLYRAFMEEFGIGPKHYLHIMRLSRVRHDLNSERDDLSITDVANRWGFWHMGKLAADYKAQFGELPSETRRGRRVQAHRTICDVSTGII